MLYIGVAPGHRRGQLGEVRVMLRRGRDLDLGPVRLSRLPAFHPVRRGAEGDDGGAAQRAHQLDTAVQALPVVDSRRGIGIHGAPAHNVLVLIARHRTRQRLPPGDGCRVAPRIEAALRVGDAGRQPADSVRPGAVHADCHDAITLF